VGRLAPCKEHRKQPRKFSDWNHLVAMVYAQLTGQRSLRQLVGSFNEHYSQHYHLGVGAIRRSTLSYANNTRDVALFSQVLAELIRTAGGNRQISEVVRLIDSSPIHLNPDIYGDFSKNNGRCQGIKLHVEYDLHGGYPTWFDITPGNVNDIEISKYLAIVPGTTYVFDRGYMKFDWWQKLVDNHCRVISRIQKMVAYKVVTENSLVAGHTNIVGDRIIQLTGNKGSKGFGGHLRMIKVRLDNSEKTIDVVSTDLLSDASVIAELYKRRWDIELLFKWIKQTLKIKNFIGETENAVKIQIITALIAFLLLAIYKQNHARFHTLLQLVVVVRADPFRKINHRQIYEKHRQYRRKNPNQLTLL